MSPDRTSRQAISPNRNLRFSKPIRTSRTSSRRSGSPFRQPIRPSSPRISSPSSTQPESEQQAQSESEQQDQSESEQQDQPDEPPKQTLRDLTPGQRAAQEHKAQKYHNERTGGGDVHEGELQEQLDSHNERTGDPSR